MRTLLDNGALTNVPDNRGEYPLHKAAYLCDEISVQILLEGKASVNQTDRDGQSALHKCCMRLRHSEPSLGILNILISCKADVNLQDKNGETPLHTSLENHEFEMAMVLLENGALATTPDSTGELPLHKAVKYDEQSLVRKMLEGHASVNQTNLVGQSALHMCCNRFCSIEVLNTLINCTADVNLRDKNGETPLHISLGKHKFDMAMVLLENGALATIPNSAGNWPLHKAVEYGKLSLVRKMLEGNASVNQTYHDGQSALHFCFGFSQQYDRVNEIAMTLISYGADVNLQDRNGNTPLHLSMRFATPSLFGASSESDQRNALSVFRKLLDAGASVNQTNHGGQSSMHLCCLLSQPEKAYIEILNSLISHKADINLQDKKGRTPLHISCAEKNWDLTMALLENGALATILDNAGKYPLHEVALDNPKAMLDMVNLCAIRQKENIELICETCELAALRMTYPDSFECMRKATVLRIEHAIPKRTLEPMECYGFCKEWETIEELETYRRDANQLKLQAILAKERIHQGQHEKLVTLIQDDLISVVLSASKSGAGALLKRHLNIWSSKTPDEERDSNSDILAEWEDELKNFETFDTTSIVQLIQISIKNKPGRFGTYDGSLLTTTTLIMKLYRRNRQEGDTSNNEQMLAKELLHQLLEEDSGRYPHQITEQNFRTLDESYTSCDYELMKMLLESGIQVNAVDSYGNTMLIGNRLLSQEAANQVIRTIELLLEKGVYPNAQNEQRETARDLLGTVRQHGEDEDITHMAEDITRMAIKRRIYQILLEYECHNSMTLKHMAAVAVKKSGYSYENVLPDALVKFVDLHKPRRDMISVYDSYSDYDVDCDYDSYGCDYDSYGYDSDW